MTLFVCVFKPLRLKKHFFFSLLRMSFPALPAHGPQGSQKQILGGGVCVLYCKWQYGMRAHMQAFPLFDAMPGRGGTMCAHVRHCAGRRDLCPSLRGGEVPQSVHVRRLAAYPGNEVIVACRDLRRLSPLSPGPAPPPPNATLPQLHVKSPSICVLIRASPPFTLG